MHRTFRHRATSLLTVTALSALTGAVLVGAAPAASAATGAYSGSGAADLVHLNAINLPGAPVVADAVVAPATGKVDSTKTPRVTARATNLDANVLQALPITQVALAQQSAPPDNAKGVHDELLTVPGDPLLNAQITTADAHARWHADDSCVLGGPISQGISKVADLNVLPGSPLGTVASLTNNNDPAGAVLSRSIIGLVKQPATAANYAVRSISSTQITAINLLGSQIVVSVVTSPRVTATATGVAGTSTVDLTQPVISVNGTTYVSGQTLSPINIPGGPIATLKVGTLTKTISADGTTATGTGNLLTLNVVTALGAPVISLTIGDVTATAKAPAGGVNCQSLTPDPLRDARKDAAAATVNPGQTFDYTVTVPNRGNADITNVKVVDTVSGTPALTLVKAVPAPVSSSGSTYTFSLGTLAPNQVKTIVLTFKVPSSAKIGTKYANTAVITGTYGGQTVTKTVHTPYPSVDGPGVGPCDLSRSTKFASHLKVFKGEKFTYYVNVFNQGGEDCTKVIVKDALVSGVTFDSCTHDCTHSGQLVTWDLGTVPAGSSVQLAVTVTTVASSGTLPNSADITPASGTGGSPSTAGPTVTNVSVLSPSFPATRGNQSLPRTGGAPLVALTGALLLGAGVFLRRRVLG